MMIYFIIKDISLYFFGFILLNLIFIFLLLGSSDNFIVQLKDESINEADPIVDEVEDIVSKY